MRISLYTGMLFLITGREDYTIGSLVVSGQISELSSISKLEIWVESDSNILANPKISPDLFPQTQLFN